MKYGNFSRNEQQKATLINQCLNIGRRRGREKKKSELNQFEPLKLSREQCPFIRNEKNVVQEKGKIVYSRS